MRARTDRRHDDPDSDPNEDPVMRKRTEIAIWSTVVLASLGLHAVAFGGLGNRHDGFGARKSRPPTLVEMSVSKPPEAKPEAPKPEPPRPTARAPKLALARPARVKAAPPPPDVPAAPPPAAESPADFTGVTMTNDGPGTGWSSATGNGEAMKGPVGRPGARVTHRNVDGGDADLGRTGPAVVAAADLSRPPVAPDLTAALARHYPPDARAKGLAGKAVLRVRIQPDGHVGDTKLESETAPGFGAACQATLRGAPWSAPVDRQGRSVATYVKYTCRFEVQ